MLPAETKLETASGGQLRFRRNRQRGAQTGHEEMRRGLSVRRRGSDHADSTPHIFHGWCFALPFGRLLPRSLPER